MRIGHLGIALFAFAALGTSSAWGSVEPAGKLMPSPVASVLSTVQERGQIETLGAPAWNHFSETSLLAFADKETDKDKEKDKDKEPPPPKRSEKCPPGHGGDDHGDHNDHGDDGHDCRGDK